MYHDVSYLLSRLINGPLSLRQIYFASSNGPVPDLAYQVDFPRLEIVLEGEFIDTSAGAALVPGFLPADASFFYRNHTLYLSGGCSKGMDLHHICSDRFCIRRGF